jgi:hypothetical protein
VVPRNTAVTRSVSELLLPTVQPTLIPEGKVTLLSIPCAKYPGSGLSLCLARSIPGRARSIPGRGYSSIPCAKYPGSGIFRVCRDELIPWPLVRLYLGLTHLALRSRWPCWR